MEEPCKAKPVPAYLVSLSVHDRQQLLIAGSNAVLEEVGEMTFSNGVHAIGVGRNFCAAK